MVLLALLLILVAGGGNIHGAQGSRVSTQTMVNYPCGDLCRAPYCYCDSGSCDCSAILDHARTAKGQNGNN
ncbi:hypothetical protein LINPERPRIM_LOCUS31823 [Linum perenne]